MNDKTAQLSAVAVDPLVSCDFYDKHGTMLREFDVVKVLLFIGWHRKHHYMYKWLRRNDQGNLCMIHLNKEDAGLVPLMAVTETVDGRKVWTTAEIVQTECS